MTPASKRSTKNRKAGRRLKSRRPSRNSLSPQSPPLSDSETRLLVRRTTERMRPERFISIMMRAHDALKSNRIARATAILAECRLKTFQTLSSAALKLARAGQRIPAMNLLFECELYCYEDTLDHIRAFFAYLDRIGVAIGKRR